MKVKKKKELIIVGGGGHCKVVVDAICKSGQFIIKGIVDPKLKCGDRIYGIPVIGNDEKLTGLYKGDQRIAFVAVGSVGDCSIREKIYKRLKEVGFNLAVVIHPSSIIASDCKIGEGTFIAAGAAINPGVKIGKNVIVNTASSIDHDCEIGDFVHVAPGAVLSGSVKIGNDTHIGAGSVINQCIEIGKNCIIGSGSVVVRNIADNCKAFGNPCKIQDI